MQHRLPIFALILTATACATEPPDPSTTPPEPAEQAQPTLPEAASAMIGMLFEVAKACSDETDSRTLVVLRHELCATPDELGAYETAAMIEECRGQLSERGVLDTQGPFAELAAPLDLAACPLPPPELTTLPASTWPGSEGESITVTLSNLCARELEFGFTPGDQQLTEVRRLPALSRQTITIPSGWGVRAREVGEDRSASWCSTDDDGGHVWIASHCFGCGAGDPGFGPP